jgi:hypothetical protein
MAPDLGDWRTIAEQASKEMDPNKLAPLLSSFAARSMSPPNGVGRSTNQLR